MYPPAPRRTGLWKGGLCLRVLPSILSSIQVHSRVDLFSACSQSWPWEAGLPGSANTPPLRCQLCFGLPCCSPGCCPGLPAEDSVVVRHGLIDTCVILLLASVSGDRHCETQKQGGCGQSHLPAHGCLEQKEPLELLGPLQGVPFPPGRLAQGPTRQAGGLW